MTNREADSYPGPLAHPHDSEPVFSEPWQAQAFAMTLRLHEQGYFSWQEWAQALSREIAAGNNGDDVDLSLCQGDANDGGARYYEYWSRALEALIVEKELAQTGELDKRQRAWKLAHHNTPHGEPVDLANAVKEQVSHSHGHDH